MPHADRSGPGALHSGALQRPLVAADDLHTLLRCAYVEMSIASIAMYVAAYSLAQGKVRDVYQLDNRLVIVTTDRQSAFDRLLAAVPYKVRSSHQFMELSKHRCRSSMQPASWLSDR